MKKKIFAAISAVAIVTAVSAGQTVFAAESLDSSAKDMIARSADEMLANLSDATVYSIDNAENEADGITYNIDDAYSVIMLESNPILAYKECGSYTELFSDETRFILPYSEGEMSFAANGEFLDMWEGDCPVMYPSEADALIEESLPDKNVNVTYTRSNKYDSTFVYVQDTDTGEEYIIPYMYISGAEQSLQPAVYKLNDFMTAMDATFEEVSISSEEHSIFDVRAGGVPMRDYTASALFALTPVTPSPEAESEMPVWILALTGIGTVLVLSGAAFGTYRLLSKKDIASA